MSAHLVKELLAMGHTVVALDDLSGGFADQVDPRATFVHGSINDHVLVDKLFAEHHFTYVYHLAAYAAEGVEPFHPALQLPEQPDRQHQPYQRFGDPWG